MDECIGCRQQKVIVKWKLCAECAEWEKTHLEELQQASIKENTCEICGYYGSAIDSHHIHGRKNSDVTIRICCNCHAEIHRGTRVYEEK